MPASHDDFYHGTRHPTLDAGDTLLPHNKLPGGRANYEGFEAHSHNKVFMDHEESRAWEWSTTGELHQGERNAVLKVTPAPDIRLGPAEHTASTAHVTERLDIMPGRQGTLPINWNQFGKTPHNAAGGAWNHPSDTDIERGHRVDPYSAHRPMSDGPDLLSLENLGHVEKFEDPHKGQGRLF